MYNPEKSMLSHLMELLGASSTAEPASAAERQRARYAGEEFSPEENLIMSPSVIEAKRRMEERNLIRAYEKLFGSAQGRSMDEIRTMLSNPKNIDPDTYTGWLKGFMG